MDNYILETKKLCKNFKHDEVVKDVSLHIKRNTIYGLLGPNGAGKSTTLKMIAGIYKPTGGQIYFCSSKWKRSNLSHMGALIENPPIYYNLTARENLKVKSIILNQSDSRIDEVLEIVNLQNTGKKLCGKFSLGMKQRLGIAIALLNKPKLLILDEPTNGLDPVGIEDLRRLISSFPKQGITVLLSSHILSEVQQVVDEIGIISDGQLKYEGKVSQGQNLEKLFMDVIYDKNRRERA